MAVDEYGSKNQPLFDGTKAGNTAADENAISNYAALVGNRKVGTGAQRRALTGGDVWDGLEFYETDSGDSFIYDSGNGGWGAAFTVGPTGGGYFTPSSGWGMSFSGNTGVEYATVAGGVIVQCYVSFFRTGGTISNTPSGNIPNVTVGHVSLKPTSIIAVPSGNSGRLAHFTIDADGSVSLTAVTPGTSIVTGDGFSFSGLYLGGN